MPSVHIGRPFVLVTLLAVAGCAALLSFEPAGSAPAVRTWTGNGANNNWTTAANWDAGPPVEGDTLIFPAVANRKSNTNDFPNFTEFEEIVVLGAGYNLSGNRIDVLDAFGHDPGAGENTLDFILDGPGNLVQQSGRLVLAGQNSHAGTTIVSGGELSVEDPLGLGEFSSTVDIYGGVVTLVAGGTYFQNLYIGGAGAGLAVLADTEWFGPMQLFGATEIDVQQDVTFEVLPDVTGGGALTKSGGGNLYLSGDNTFAGVLEIQQGMVTVQRSAGLGSDLDGTVIGNGAVLALEAGVDLGDEFVQLDGILSSVDGVTHVGRLLLGSNAEIHVAQGILRLPNGIDQAGNSLSIAKKGPGTLEFEGAGDFSGLLDVYDGAISVRGTVLADVYLDVGTLTGEGEIGGVTGVSGIIRPGVQGIGNLTINGPLVLSPDMDVDFVLDSGAEYTSLRVHGPITLDNAVLHMEGAGEVPQGGAATLMENLSGVPIDGEFLLRPEGSTLGVNGTFFELTYEGGPEPGNDFVMTPESGAVDIGVTIVGSGASAPAAVYAFDVRVRNFGEDPADLLVDMLIPAGASFISSGDGVICSLISEAVDADNYHCAITGLVPGAIREFEVVVAITASAGTQLVFDAYVEPEDGDPPANNYAEHIVNVAAGGLGFKIGLPGIARDGGW